MSNKPHLRPRRKSSGRARLSGCWWRFSSSRSSPWPSPWRRPAASYSMGGSSCYAEAGLGLSLVARRETRCHDRAASRQTARVDPGQPTGNRRNNRHICAPAAKRACPEPAARNRQRFYSRSWRYMRMLDAPKCRHDHMLKQHPRWRVDQLSDGTFRWTIPSGRTYTTEPTRYPT
jgi:hypothetical protein